MTVYLDSVFALNFAVNWLLLCAAARLGAAAVRPESPPALPPPGWGNR